MRLRILPLWVVVFLCSASFALAQEKSVNPGINDNFKDPDVDEFVKKFEGESREIYTKRLDIVRACKLKPGMAVADVGAGTGLFTRLFAKEVGPKGKVYAVDIAGNFLKHIEKFAKEENLDNVATVLCDQFSTKLPPNSVDVVFICDTYHHFEFPYRTLSSIHEALRPGGQIVLIDFHRIKGVTKEWTMNHVRAGQDVFSREIESSGFRKLDEQKLLTENYFVRFAKTALRGQ
jgi:ubiquinone/menaquinone biosynthesis C-methylase UbiE